MFLKPETVNTFSEEKEEIKATYKEFNYGDYSTIKLLHTQSRRN